MNESSLWCCPFSEDPLQDTHPLQVPLITVYVFENASKEQETSCSPLSVGGHYGPTHTINFLRVGGSKHLFYSVVQLRTIQYKRNEKATWKLIDGKEKESDPNDDQNSLATDWWPLRELLRHSLEEGHLNSVTNKEGNHCNCEHWGIFQEASVNLLTLLEGSCGIMENILWNV